MHAYQYAYGHYRTFKFLLCRPRDHAPPQLSHVHPFIWTCMHGSIDVIKKPQKAITQKKGKTAGHRGFQGRHRSQYWSDLNRLVFRVLMGSGILRLVFICHGDVRPRS